MIEVPLQSAPTSRSRPLQGPLLVREPLSIEKSKNYDRGLKTLVLKMTQFKARIWLWLAYLFDTEWKVDIVLMPLPPVARLRYMLAPYRPPVLCLSCLRKVVLVINAPFQKCWHKLTQENAKTGRRRRQLLLRGAHRDLIRTSIYDKY